MQIIVAATRNAAHVLRCDQVLGTIASGKVADFLILRADPLVTIQNVQQIDTVVKGGKAYEQRKLHTDAFFQ